MNDLTDPAGIVALAAAGIAVVCLLLLSFLAVRLRRIRMDQRVVLGATGREDLVDHAAHLHQAFTDLHDRLDELAEQLQVRVDVAEDRLDGMVTYRALVRYDAYGELSGHQSMSLAMLDSRRNGLVLTAISHRDTQRLYAKQVVDGTPEHPLSPEEDEAVRLALSGQLRSVTLGQ